MASKQSGPSVLDRFKAIVAHRWTALKPSLLIVGPLLLACQTILKHHWTLLKPSLLIVVPSLSNLNSFNGIHQDSTYAIKIYDVDGFKLVRTVSKWSGRF